MALGSRDLICIGATRSTRIAQALFGSIPERVGEETSRPVAMVRGPEYRPRTLAQAVVERLGDRLYRPEG